MTLTQLFPTVLGRWLLFISLFALAVPSASALQIQVEPNQTIGNITAPSGESIIIHGAGPLILTGTLQAGHGGPGEDGGGITLNINGPLLLHDGARFVAGNGGDGASRHGRGNVHGQDGGEGGSIILNASIVHGAIHARPGDGGNGGSATATGHPATARGGNGGDAGRLVANAPIILLTAPRGGDGGDAEARGDDACTGVAGRDDHVQTPNETTGDARHAEARGGAGTCAPPGQDGAPGGNATAIGGNGGYTEDGPGGNGGNATAIGGRGGDALDLCYGSTEAAKASGFVKAGDGGVGGTPSATGGNGGTGLNGGRGGDAYTESRGGNGGNATMPLLFGAGGTNQGEGGGVKGGGGGRGIVNGGPGGGGIGYGFGGDSGSGCGPLPQQGIPSVSLAVFGLALLGAVVVRRGSP